VILCAEMRLQLIQNSNKQKYYFNAVVNSQRYSCYQAAKRQRLYYKINSGHNYN
jgi:hypothetical protein